MHFEKISFNQWLKDYISCYNIANGVYDAEKAYNNIKLPKQGTARSMGMDFFASQDISIQPESYITIPTGIRWVVPPIDDNIGLMIVPRSGLGFKYGVRLANTVGIIDADYYQAENEGHIMIKLYNPSPNMVKIEAGKGFAQGIITDFYICDGAESDEDRVGGFGSTG